MTTTNKIFETNTSFAVNVKSSISTFQEFVASIEKNIFLGVRLVIKVRFCELLGFPNFLRS